MSESVIIGSLRYRIQTPDQLETCFLRLVAKEFPEQGWLLTVEPYAAPHSDAQRALLWVVWGEIADQLREQTGTEYTANTIHDLVLGRVYGWREVTLVRLGVDEEVYTEVHAKPLKTMTTAAGKSRRMTRDEMSLVIEMTNIVAGEYMVPARVAA